MKKIFLTVFMLNACMGLYGMQNTPDKSVQLTNGVSVSAMLCASVVQKLYLLSWENNNVLKELLKKCQNDKYKLSANPQNILEESGFSFPVDKDTKNIILASLKEATIEVIGQPDQIMMEVVFPVAEDSKK